jgi:hypothetical protein
LVKGVEVKPTIKGIKAGIDEPFEKAMELILNYKLTSKQTVINRPPIYWQTVY